VDVEVVADRLIAIPNVVAVVLGGSRATGAARPDSDWDLGVYYDGTIDTAAIRALGYEGQVFEPGEWSPLMNGGAWFVIDGVKLDLIYREVAFVRHWIDEANEGRFRVELLNGYLAGFDTTILVGEVAVAKPLRGTLPLSVRAYPDALRRTAAEHWRGRRDFNLLYAESHDARGDVVAAAGLRARAAIEDAHAVMAERGEWVFNEKGLLARAGVTV
jgi:predicted nucleotidyltransferase